jgi:2-methylisocitrate lyase-like PEP mutase family enzyme
VDEEHRQGDWEGAATRANGRLGARGTDQVSVGHAQPIIAGVNGHANPIAPRRLGPRRCLMKTQAEKAAAFVDLHAADGAFVAPNPWDPGSARILAGLGFPALTTTSSGHARSRGAKDYGCSRDDVLAHVRAMVAAVDVPITGDLENGFGCEPEAVAETIRLAAAAGLVGGSIEDATGDPREPIFEVARAADRIRAGAAAARQLPFPFLLTGRTDNFLHGRTDLDDVIRRLQAYQEAGAHVLLATGLPTVAAIRSVVASVDRPVHVLIGPRERLLTVAELATIGVKRISVGGALASAALSGLVRAARELAGGSLEWTRGVLATGEIDALLERGAAGTG